MDTDTLVVGIIIIALGVVVCGALGWMMSRL